MKSIIIITKQAFTSLLFASFTFICSLNLSGQTTYGEKRVVFSQDQHIKMNPILRDTPYTRFTPIVAEIDTIDNISKNNFPKFYNGEEVKAFENYYRQYYGLVFNGRKFIFIDGYCFKPEGFLENTSGFMGGGRCYFKMLVDISNKKIHNFYFNAPK